MQRMEQIKLHSCIGNSLYFPARYRNAAACIFTVSFGNKERHVPVIVQPCQSAVLPEKDQYLCIFFVHIAVVANKDKAVGLSICGQAMLQIIQNSIGIFLLSVCGRSALRVWLHLYGFHLKHDHVLTDKGANGR